MSQLTGKVALITGGSRGIGAGIARGLAGAGADISLTYVHNADAANVVVKEIEKTGRRCVAHAADMMRPEDVNAAVDHTIHKFGRLDILVNNAGFMDLSGTAFQDISLDTVDQSILVNIRAYVLAAQRAALHLGPGGRIINIGSCLGERVPGPGQTLYATTKAAITGLTKGLARDLGPQKITVNQVSPGPVDTDMNPANGPFADMQRDLTAVGHYGTPSDIASAVTFLASEESSFITGSALAVDGGNTA